MSRRLVGVAVLLWVGRWLALELAAWSGHWGRPGPAPKDSPRAPGLMPGPFDLKP